jgi:hypothetical protein
MWEKGTLICERVVFKASGAPHIYGVNPGVKVALLACTFEPGASISLGDGSCELYMEDCIDKANLAVNGSPTKTGQAHESIESVFRSFCEEQQLPGAQCAIVIDGALTHSLAHGCSEADRVGLHCVFKIIAATCIALLVEEGKISYDDNPLTLLGADLSEAHEYWQDLTIAHLLTHTSGFGFGLEELLPMDDTDDAEFGEAGADGSSQCAQPAQREFKVRRALDSDSSTACYLIISNHTDHADHI